MLTFEIAEMQKIPLWEPVRWNVKVVFDNAVIYEDIIVEGEIEGLIEHFEKRYENAR